ADLPFLDRPPKTAMTEARRTLREIGALDENGALTPHGQELARLPLPPRLAHMVMIGASLGLGRRAAQIAVLLTETGLGGRDIDVSHRLELLDRDRSRRARAAMALAARWARLAGSGGGAAGRGDAVVRPN